LDSTVTKAERLSRIGASFSGHRAVYWEIKTRPPLARRSLSRHIPVAGQKR